MIFINSLDVEKRHGRKPKSEKIPRSKEHRAECITNSIFGHLQELYPAIPILSFTNLICILCFMVISTASPSTVRLISSNYKFNQSFRPTLIKRFRFCFSPFFITKKLQPQTLNYYFNNFYFIFLLLHLK